MEVLLINPPRVVPQHADFPPMGLTYVASYLRENGVKVFVLDAASFSWRKLAEAIKDSAPKIVGFSCWTLERGQIFKAAKLVREILPGTKIIVGGHHATAFPEHMFKLAYADAVVLGEGEITALELVKALLENKEIREIKGIAYRENGRVVINKPNKFIEDLDIIPFPSYDEFNLDEYLGLPESKERAATIITSRGCPYKCIYCSAARFWELRWRARSPENVLKEIEWLYNDHGVRNFMFFDDNFTIKKDRAIEICQRIIKRNLHINWVAESHVTHVNEELLGWMKKSGCYRIDYGVESGSPKILRNIKKGQTVEQIEMAFKLTHEAGIKPRAYLVVGSPGEDEATIEETVKLMEKIKPYDTHSGQILWILPDTEVYELAKSKGIISDDFWIENDSVIYYTGDSDDKELKALRDRLIDGLSKNKGYLWAPLNAWLRKNYTEYPFLQKIRKWRKNFKVSLK
jgi:radical SAM superfamily enzyme YgiQ (UPF0313 family)